MQALATGTIISGRYRLEEELGGGAMGRVYRASVVAGGAAAPNVAIKVLSPEVGDRQDLVERLEREALILLGVEHHALRRVHEFGFTEGGAPFLVSELLEGQGLDERLAAEPPLSAAGMLEITIEVLDGLDTVHSAGVVHRDLKPSNIFIEESGAPKLIDFGVSKGAIAGAALTITGEILGTPVFMSPEQADRAKGATPAADVYGMGAVLYDALAGAPPFEAPSVGMLLMAVAFEDPEPLTEVRPGIPPVLAELVGQAMAKAPEDRPQSAAAFAVALREILEAQSEALTAIALPRASASTPPPPAAGPSPERDTAAGLEGLGPTPKTSISGLVVGGVVAFVLMTLAIVVLSLL